MSRGRGYLLPEGEAYTDDRECLILFYPNKDEYRRALFGALDYFGTWIAWERDEDKRGKDAARAWAECVELTRECIEMGTCDTLLELLEKIEKNTRTCCGETTYVSYQDNVVITTVITPGIGAPPGTYGETAVTDWDEWLEYVCYHAHLYVDDLVATAEKLDLAMSVGGYVLDFIAHLFSLVQWRYVEEVIPVNFSVIQAVFNALGEGAIDNEFETLADDFETYRSEIVCALIQGTSLEEAIQDIVGSGILWTAYYQWLNYDTTQAIIYEGEVEGYGYLPPVKRSDCECEFVPEAIPGYTWEVPDYDTFQPTTNIDSKFAAWDPVTGIYTLSVTLLGGTGGEFAAVWDPWDGLEAFRHAYAWKLIAYSGDGDWEARYEPRLDCKEDQSGIGKWYAGYNTDLHSGATWDDLVAQFDVVANHTEDNHDRVRLIGDGPLVPYDTYTFEFRVLGLKET